MNSDVGSVPELKNDQNNDKNRLMQNTKPPSLSQLHNILSNC